MCQRNGIALATSHTCIDNVGQPADGAAGAQSPQPPASGQPSEPRDRRKGFIDRIVDRADGENATGPGKKNGE